MEDCYFYLDSSIPENARCISVVCMNCKRKDPKLAAWFWPGSKKGYGPFEIKCNKCEKIIYEPRKNYEETKTSG